MSLAGFNTLKSHLLEISPFKLLAVIRPFFRTETSVAFSSAVQPQLPLAGHLPGSAATPPSRRGAANIAQMCQIKYARARLGAQKMARRLNCKLVQIC